MNSKTQSLVPAMGFRVRSERLPKEMDVVGYFCPNPECPCEDATLYFYEADGSFSVKLFKLVLNYAAWRLISTEVYKDDRDYARIIHEFMDGLTDDIKSMILSGKEDARSSGHVLRDDIDYSELSIDSMVCYPDIYHVAPYEQWVFEFGTAQYLVLDYYCPNPKCDCMDVLLTVQVVKDNKAYDTPVLEYRVNFSTGKGICEKKDVSISGELYADFLEYLEGRGIGFFEERYLRIKKWGKDYLQNKAYGTSMSPVPTGPKIGRNTPCPCGSGLKYKKCCGR